MTCYATKLSFYKEHANRYEYQNDDELAGSQTSLDSVCSGVLSGLWPTLASRRTEVSHTSISDLRGIQNASWRIRTKDGITI